MQAKIFKSLISALILLLLCNCNIKETTSKTELKDNWTFKNTSESEWKKATVPGSVHTDLIQIGAINDPFYRLEEHHLQWIDKKDWEYKTHFEVSKKQFQKSNHELEFLGLDTYSSIYLNDTLLQKTDNMFRTYSVDVKRYLVEGNNTLRIHFDSPIKNGLKKYDSLNFRIPVSDNDLAEIGKVENNKQVSIFTRKAGYHFGWDWGPRLVTSGIWRPINLKSWNSHKIEDLFIQQNSIDSIAKLTAQIEIITHKKDQKAKIEIFVENQLVHTIKKKLSATKNTYSIPFTIESPELWWPNGMGNQKLYNISATVTVGSYKDVKSERIGLRTVELVQKPDSIGTSFYFKVNGHPVFMKGANYIPQDVFLPRVKKENYRHILNSAKQANMNMLRVWGGGIYENDEFYDLCDEMGLLVWQDFMFACAMFPGDKSFLNNVKQEAIDNVKRLRNHTSIALWCGNNEILSAWENWGWKNKVIEEQSKEVADTIWKAYDDIFHKILPDVITTYDNTRSYWPSSPGSEFGKKESFHKGDAHYWMVWWGKQPFDNYNKAIPRFMSEYGFQSFPEFSSVKKYTNPKDYDVYSEVMKSHQRSSIGNSTIEEYMLRHYKKPKDFEHFLYVSQLLQAHGIKTGIEAHRRNRDRCMGSLYWQINDCWPVASWSSIDYFGKWKAVHYAAKKAFKNFLISYEEKEELLNVFIISDSINSTKATLKTKLIDFEGNQLKNWEQELSVTGNASVKQLTLNTNDLLINAPLKNILLHTELISNNKVVAENTHYFSPFKALDFPKPNITYNIQETTDAFKVTLKTDKLAKNVFLKLDSNYNFSDNYFDMLPKSEKTVSIAKDSLNDLTSFKNKLDVKTLIDSY